MKEAQWFTELLEQAANDKTEIKDFDIKELKNLLGLQMDKLLIAIALNRPKKTTLAEAVKMAMYMMKIANLCREE